VQKRGRYDGSEEAPNEDGEAVMCWCSGVEGWWQLDLGALVHWGAAHCRNRMGRERRLRGYSPAVTWGGRARSREDGF
jgi:hypothetical protein